MVRRMDSLEALSPVSTSTQPPSSEISTTFSELGRGR